MTPDDALTVRIDQHRRDLDRIDRRLDELDKDKADLDDMQRLADEIKALRRTLTTLGIGIVLALVTFAFGLAQLLLQGH